MVIYAIVAALEDCEEPFHGVPPRELSIPKSAQGWKITYPRRPLPLPLLQKGLVYLAFQKEFKPAFQVYLCVIPGIFLALRPLA